MTCLTAWWCVPIPALLILAVAWAGWKLCGCSRKVDD
jgi:hypothetical protein